MNGKSLGMLILAVLCGLGAMYGTTRLISKDKTPQKETQDVLVAVRDLKIEEVVKPDMVKVIQMDKTAVPPGAFASVKDVEERWVQVVVLEGEPLVDKKLAARGSPPGLVSRIPNGMRAFAIEVNEQTGVSGFVLPGHRVDVVQLVPVPNGQTESETVLQDVLVLASGQTFTRPDDRSIQARTVTLAVTPEEVDTLVSAKAHGALTLSLRGLNDHAKEVSRKRKEPEKVKDPEPAPKAVAVAVKEPEPPPPPPPPPPAPVPPTPPPARYVTIYRGLDNMRRHRIDQSVDEEAGGETVVAAPTAASAPTGATRNN